MSLLGLSRAAGGALLGSGVEITELGASRGLGRGLVRFPVRVLVQVAAQVPVQVLMGVLVYVPVFVPVYVLVQVLVHVPLHVQVHGWHFLFFGAQHCLLCAGFPVPQDLPCPGARQQQ